MDPQQDPTWPGHGAAERDLEGEAMRRRIKSRLFGEHHPAVQIGRFRVIETLGQGGMGVVYAAEDAQLDRLVAIKVIRDDRLRDGVKGRARLLREARMQAKLSHPNVVQIHEVSESETGLFIVMELVQGSTLRQWLDRGPHSLAAILERFVEAARGLSAAHRAGIVHRDFKMANALVGEDGRVRIADFGLAVGEFVPPETDPERVPEAPAVPGATSRYAGTPAYMSPEQALGESCDARSDQYSFAVALTEAVLGHPPLPASERLKQRGAAAFAPDRKLPQWLQDALSRALALEPRDRFATMDALVAVLVDSPRRRRQRWFIVGIGASLACAGIAGGMLRDESPQSQCARADERVTALWTDERRAAIATAFTATGLPYADESWQRASETLDQYAARLAEQSLDNCEATRERGEQSDQRFGHRAVCLDRSRSAFATLLDVFAKADGIVVADAQALSADLPEPKRCQYPATPTSDDRPIRPVDAEVRSFLDRAKILLDLHQGRQAVDLLADRLKWIESNGGLGDAAEARLLLAIGQGRLLGDGAAAEDSLHPAYDLAVEGGRDELKWQIWKELARVHADVLGAPRMARHYLAHAKTEGPQDSEIVAAALLAVESDILLAEDRAAEAVESRRKALLTVQSYYPAYYPEVIEARRSLAAGLGEAGRAAEARDHDERLLAELHNHFGADQPVTARVEFNLGLDHFDLGELPQARKHLEKARSVLMATYGASHPQVADSDLMLARIDLADGDLPRALIRGEAALNACNATLPRAHVQRVNALVLLSELYRQNKDYEHVLTVNRELLSIHETDPTRGIELPGVLTNIGECMCLLDRCVEAMPYFNQLERLYADESPPEPALRAVPLRGIGQVYLAQGNLDMATVFLDQALTILEREPLERAGLAEMRIETIRDLAETLTTRKREPERVRQLRQRAAALEAELSSQ